MHCICQLVGQASLNPSFASQSPGETRQTTEQPTGNLVGRSGVVGRLLSAWCSANLQTHYGRTAPGRSVPLSKMHFRQFSLLRKCLDGVSLSAKMAAVLVDWNVELSPTCQSKKINLASKIDRIFLPLFSKIVIMTCTFDFNFSFVSISDTHMRGSGLPACPAECTPRWTARPPAELSSSRPGR